MFPSPPAASCLTPLAACTAPGFTAGGSPLAVGSRPPPLRIAALRGCEPRPQGVPPVVSPLRLPPKRWRPLLPWALHLHGCRSCSTGFMGPLKRVRSAAERAMPSELVCTRPSRSTAARVLHHSQECTWHPVSILARNALPGLVYSFTVLPEGGAVGDWPLSRGGPGPCSVAATACLSPAL